MSDEDLTTEEERRRLADRSTPVPEADALEQSAEIDEDDDEDMPSPADDVPEADALEQARGVPHDDDRR
jgi:hypothetical protein